MYCRLPFGVSSSPGIFQRCMENILQGISHVCVYLDDILITGSTHEEHIANLKEVLHRLSKAGLRLKLAKCTFMAKEVVYLGHKLSAEGLFPTPEKIKAIQKAPHPKNLTELKAFLGLVNYYSRFIPNLSSILEPLYRLLRKSIKWHWKRDQEKSFQKAKAMLQSPDILAYYDPSKKLLLTCDASPYGVAAVLSQIDKEIERPIGYVSRSLTKAERNYSQLEKEALALIFGVTKFHKYLYGRHFLLVSDHKPLASIFHSQRSIPAMASARIQRWALLLSAYQYDIIHKSGKNIGNADGLSRLPLNETVKNSPIPEIVCLMEDLSHSVVSANLIKSWTAKDPVMSRVYHYVQNGWPDTTLDHNYKPYFTKRNELSVFDGCLLWGSRVVIPGPGQNTILEELHQGHPGMFRMKGLARGYVWWPGIDSEIEEKVKSCYICQSQHNSPPSAPLNPWSWPEKPWSRLHIDYAGPFLGKMFLIVIDAYSKWIEVFQTNSANAAFTVEKLRMCFATHGIPDTIV